MIGIKKGSIQLDAAVTVIPGPIASPASHPDGLQ